MTIDEIREAKRGRPFVPFVLRVIGGPPEVVNDPDYLLAPPGAFGIACYDAETRSHRVLRWADIGALEHRPEQTAPAGRG